MCLEGIGDKSGTLKQPNMLNFQRRKVHFEEEEEESIASGCSQKNFLLANEDEKASASSIDGSLADSSMMVLAEVKPKWRAMDFLLLKENKEASISGSVTSGSLSKRSVFKNIRKAVKRFRRKYADAGTVVRPLEAMVQQTASKTASPDHKENVGQPDTATKLQAGNDKGYVYVYDIYPGGLDGSDDEEEEGGGSTFSTTPRVRTEAARHTKNDSDDKTTRKDEAKTLKKQENGYKTIKDEDGDKTMKTHENSYKTIKDEDDDKAKKKDDENDGTSQEIRVFTLNCWGLMYISDKRNERMEAIGQYLAESNYDIVMLQEVWTEEDYQHIRSLAKLTFPHAHFFDNGIIGTGMCIFTREPISDATFHEFAMNGYPHKVLHGDWFAGKGLGVCQIYYKGFDLHIYMSHFHAEYDRNADCYLGHRVIHALESAQWIKLSSSSADLIIFAGDLNSEPVDVPYKLVRHITPLVDSWEDLHGREGGETCEVQKNSFTHQSFDDHSNSKHDGKRIDYIFYRSGPNIKTETVQCSLPLPKRIPDKTFSYSDHEAVCATIKLQRTKGAYRTASEYRNLALEETRSACVSTVLQAIEILKNAEQHALNNQYIYGWEAFLVLVILVASFLPLAVLEDTHHAFIELCLFLPRFILTCSCVFLIVMATLFTRREMNAINSAKATLQLILNQDLHVK